MQFREIGQQFHTGVGNQKVSAVVGLAAAKQVEIPGTRGDHIDLSVYTDHQDSLEVDHSGRHGHLMDDHDLTSDMEPALLQIGKSWPPMLAQQKLELPKQ